jgi:hypothetical protein
MPLLIMQAVAGLGGVLDWLGSWVMVHGVHKWYI